MTCPHSHSDGAYVLGALCPAERAAYESHLNECEACAAAVARLAPVPGLLGRVDPVFLQRPDPLLAGPLPPDPPLADPPLADPPLADPPLADPLPAEAALADTGTTDAGGSASAAAPTDAGGSDPATAPTGPARLTRLVRAASEERRRQARTRRWQLVAVAAAVAVLMAGGGVAWSVVTGAGSTPPERTAMWPVTGDPESVAVTAEVDLSATGAGVAVWWRCAYPAGRTGQTWDDPAPWVFRLVAVGQDGSREQIGSWLAGPGDEVTMTGITRFGWDELDRLELRGYDDTHLLTYEPS